MLVIGIAGGSASGKTTVVNKIIEGFGDDDVTVLSQDSYYKDNSHLSLEERKKMNYDHPRSLEFDLLQKHIKALKEGKSIEEPVYSYITCTRSNETRKIKPKKVIIVEGILILTDAGLRDLFDIKIFVHTRADDRLIRLIRRDTIERGRDVNEVIDRYCKTVQPMHDQFIESTKDYADLIIPEGGANRVAIDVMSAVIEKKLR